jgi:TonB family protein
MRSAIRAVLLGAGCVLGVACGAADAGPVEEPVPVPDPAAVEYPVALWDQGVQGETEVMVRVNERGDVDSVYVYRTSGWSEFDSAAVAGVRRMRFTPGREGEKRVAMWTKMPVRFAQDSTSTAGQVAGPGEDR